MKKNLLALVALYCSLFSLAEKSLADWVPSFDFSATFTQNGWGGYYYGETVYNAIWLEAQNSGQVVSLAQLPAAGSRFRITGEITGTSPTLTIVTGYQTIYPDSNGAFSFETTSTSIRFYSNGSSFELLAEFEQLPPCHKDHALPPQAVCPDWWNDNNNSSRRLNTNCLGYANNEKRNYQGLGNNGAPLTFANSNTSEEAVSRMRSSLASAHGWSLKSTDVNIVPDVEIHGRIAAVGVYYVHGINSSGRLINDFHVIRKDKGHTSWTEKGGQQPVGTLSSDAAVISTLNTSYGDTPTNDPLGGGGNYFIGYFKVPNPN